MSTRDDLLRDAVDRKLSPVHMTDYGQIKEYLIEKHGTRGWIGAMAQLMSGSSSRAKSDKPYQAARRSIERFEKGQFKSMKKYDAQIAKVGEKLPPVGKQLKGDSITITVKGTQAGSKGKGTREREITVTMTGGKAQRFIQEPTYSDLWEEYGVDPDLFDEGDYEIDVYSVA